MGGMRCNFLVLMIVVLMIVGIGAPKGRTRSIAHYRKSLGTVCMVSSIKNEGNFDDPILYESNVCMLFAV